MSNSYVCPNSIWSVKLRKMQYIIKLLYYIEQLHFILKNSLEGAVFRMASAFLPWVESSEQCIGSNSQAGRKVLPISREGSAYPSFLSFPQHPSHKTAQPATDPLRKTTVLYPFNKVATPQEQICQTANSASREGQVEKCCKCNNKEIIPRNS